jgi:hypothetical protein
VRPKVIDRVVVASWFLFPDVTGERGEFEAVERGGEVKDWAELRSVSV